MVCTEKRTVCVCATSFRNRVYDAISTAFACRDEVLGIMIMRAGLLWLLAGRATIEAKALASIDLALRLPTYAPGSRTSGSLHSP